MSQLEKIKSYIGKEFIDSPSVFMRWFMPLVLTVEERWLEFQYRVRTKWLKVHDLLIAETSIIKRGRQFVRAQCKIWNEQKGRLIAKGSSKLFKTGVKK